MLNPFFYIQAIFLALGQIWVNKTRSFLTTLGIIIGVASVISVIAAISGLKGFILEQMETIGANKLFIFPDRPDGEPRNKYPWELVRLKPHELKAIQENCESIVEITPITEEGTTIQYQDTIRESVGIIGIWPGWHQIENRDILIGRPFTQLDEDNARQVCIVNDKAIEELRLDTDPTGDHILIDGRRFMIVGVVETVQPTIFDERTNATEVFMPFSTAVKFKDDRYFFYIICKIQSPEMAEEAEAEVKFLLRQSRKIKADQPDTFEVEAIDQFIDQFKAIAAGITTVAAGIVGISLLVGGIGIMNIMLVSVSERTREIGLRKAVGATPAAILLQFLLESITLCFVGGAIGVAGGEAFAFLINNIPESKIEAVVPWWAVAISFGFSALVGVAFGMFPAIKAARLDPIEALRHE